MAGSEPNVISGTRESAQPRRVVRQPVTVGHLDPWSVLRLSLVLYFCFLLVALLGLSVFWVLLSQLGVIDGLTRFLTELQLTWVVNGEDIARALFLIGVLNVVLWSAINVFLAFLYNLVADVIGGLRIELDVEE